MSVSKKPKAFKVILEARVCGDEYTHTEVTAESVRMVPLKGLLDEACESLKFQIMKYADQLPITPIVPLKMVEGNLNVGFNGKGEVVKIVKNKIRLKKRKANPNSSKTKQPNCSKC